MSKSKRQAEREWQGRKQAKNPHGKVRSLEEIADDVEKKDRK